MAGPSISRITKLNFFAPQEVSHWSLWTMSELNGTQRAACRAVPRDGGFLREVAASDKTWSHQAGDRYLRFLGAGSYLLLGYIRVRTLTQLEVNQR